MTDSEGEERRSPWLGDRRAFEATGATVVPPESSRRARSSAPGGRGSRHEPRVIARGAPRHGGDSSGRRPRSQIDTARDTAPKQRAASPAGRGGTRVADCLV